MTLRAVDLHLLKLPLTVPYHLSFGDVTDFDTIVVEVESNPRPYLRKPSPRMLQLLESR